MLVAEAIHAKYVMHMRSKYRGDMHRVGVCVAGGLHPPNGSTETG